MFQVNMICHLWDLLDEGVGEVLDRLQGELGVSGVCVPVVCPPLAQLRCRPGAGPRIFRTRGGAFFTPQEAYYQATRCKPAASSWLKNRNPLQLVAEQCRKRKLDCRAVVHSSSAGLLARHHPQTAAKTVFGDAWPERVCLVNPDVQALLVGLCRDLAENYQLSAIEMRGFHTGRIRPDSLGFDPPFDLGPGGYALLQMCFCESCRQLADRGSEVSPGVGPESAARSAEVRLRRIFEAGPAAGGLDLTWEQLLADDAPLRKHAASQWRALAGLLESIRRECDCPVILHTYDDLLQGAAGTHPLADGGAIGAAAAVLAHVRGTSQSETDEVARTVVGLAGPGQGAEVEIRPYVGQPADAEPTDAPALVRNLSRLVELGIRSVNLDNCGQIPESAWPGVKQAIRFARRTTADA